MEPVTTTAMIGTVVGYLAKKLSDSKSFIDFTNEFSDAAVKWIKPLFLKDDDKPKEVLENLQEKPDSQARQEMAKSLIAMNLEDNPNALSLIEEMIATIEKKQASGESIVISNNKNINIENSSNVILAPISNNLGAINIGSNNVNQDQAWNKKRK